MHLFELAIELGERSADMAEAAESLGFEGITPTSELTPEQVQAFRARYAKAAPPPPAGSAYQPPSSWGPPPGTGAPAPAPSGSGRSLGVGQILLIVAALAGVAALFGYMMSNSGPDARQEQQLAASAEEHEAELEAEHEAARWAALAARRRSSRSSSTGRSVTSRHCERAFESGSRAISHRSERSSHRRPSQRRSFASAASSISGPSTFSLSECRFAR